MNGKCNVAFAKKPYGMMYIGWAISKNYSQFEKYQRGYVNCGKQFKLNYKIIISTITECYE